MRSKLKRIALVAALAVFATKAVTAANVQNMSKVMTLLDRWEQVATPQGSDSAVWRDMMRIQLEQVSPSTLDRLLAVGAGASRQSLGEYYKGFIDTLGSDILSRLEKVKGQGTKALKPAASVQQTENLRGAVPGPSADGVMPKTLGSSTNDQVFTPITPCRVVDTRNLGGPIGPFATRNFFYFTSAASTNWNSLQGGVNGAAGTVCPGTVLSGFLPSSAVATITVTGQGGGGNLIVWQGTNPVASASTMSYPATGDTSSLATIPAGGRSGTGPGGTVEDFGVFVNAFTATNVVVDIVGYYSQPAATALDQTIVVGTPDTCTNGNACAATAICTAGYTVTGGGFQNGAFAANNDVVYSGPNTFSAATGWLCQSQNASGSTQTLTCVAICARVPGH